MRSAMTKFVAKFMIVWLCIFPPYYELYRAAVAQDAQAVEGQNSAAQAVGGNTINQTNLNDIRAEFSSGFDQTAAQSQGQSHMTNPDTLHAEGSSTATTLSTGVGIGGEAYQSIQNSRNNPNAVSARAEVRNSMGLYGAQNFIAANSGNVFSEFTTGCVSNTFTQTDVVTESTSTHVESCTQMITPTPGGQCSVTRDVTLVPVETKVVFSILPNQVGGSGINDGPPLPWGIADSVCATGVAEQYCGDFNSCQNDRQLYEMQCELDCPEINGEQQLECVTACLDEAWQHFSRCEELRPGITGAFVAEGDAVRASGNATEWTNVGINGITRSVKKSFFVMSSYPAGTYLVANHAAVPQPWVTQADLLTAGSQSDNWHYQMHLELANAGGFEIQATLYRVETNSFVGPECDQTHLPDFMNGSCTGTATCTNEPPCIEEDGVNICASGPTAGYSELLFSWGPSAGLNQMCWQADIQMTGCAPQDDSCEYGTCTCNGLTGGEYTECMAGFCWTDVNGVEHCPDNLATNWTNNLGDLGGWVDNCQDTLAKTNCLLDDQLPEDRACILAKPDTIDPVTGATIPGECYMRDVKFNCRDTGIINPIPGGETTTTDCDGMLQCVGDNCVQQRQENNTGFGRVATALSAVQALQFTGASCLTTDPNSCEMFKGEKRQCKDPVGGVGMIVPDCCAVMRAGGEAASDLELAMLVFTAGASMSLNGDEPGQVGSQHDGYSSPMTMGSGFATNPWQSAWDSQMTKLGLDSTDGSTSSGERALIISTGGLTYIAQGFYNLAPGFFGSLYDIGPAGINWVDPTMSGLLAYSGLFTNVLNTVFIAFTILSILGQIVFKCEDEELEFSAQYGQRACHYVGKYCWKSINLTPFGPKKCLIQKQTYCCYNSAFARIIQEQIKAKNEPFSARRGYNGPEWGTPKAPSCGSLTLGDLATLDWSNVDLSEWEEIALEGLMVPNFNNPPGFGKSTNNQEGMLNSKPRPWRNRFGGGGSSVFGQSNTGYDNMFDLSKGLDQTHRGTMKAETEALMDQENAAFQLYDPKTIPWYGQTFQKAIPTQSAPPTGFTGRDDSPGGVTPGCSGIWCREYETILQKQKTEAPAKEGSKKE